MDGAELKVAAQHPMAMLHVSIEQCEGFRKVLATAMRQTPPTRDNPWGVVIYCDEVGHNPVGRDNRKVQCLYWSFLELGSKVLHTEPAWFTVCA